MNIEVGMYVRYKPLLNSKYVKINKIKEIEDALHMLLHCSLKDTEYETQVEQYKIVRNYITNLEQENKQLKDNWNKLKEYCKENTLCYEVGDDENTKLIGSRIHGLNVLDKMQELEQGSDSNGQ